MRYEALNMTLIKEVSKHNEVYPFKSSEVIGPGMKKDSLIVKLTSDISLN